MFKGGLLGKVNLSISSSQSSIKDFIDNGKKISEAFALGLNYFRDFILMQHVANVLYRVLGVGGLRLDVVVIPTSRSLDNEWSFRRRCQHVLVTYVHMVGLIRFKLWVAQNPTDHEAGFALQQRTTNNEALQDVKTVTKTMPPHHLSEQDVVRFLQSRSCKKSTESGL